MKKKILAVLLLVLSLSFALSACGSDSKSSKKSSKKSESSDDDYDTDNSKKKEKKKKEAAEAAPAAEASDDEVSLEDIISSDEAMAAISELNKTLEQSGLYCEIDAEGSDTLCLLYQFTEQMDLGGMSKSEIQAGLDAQLAPIFEEQAKSWADSFASMGAKLNAIHVLLYNADDTLLYETYYEI